MDISLLSNKAELPKMKPKAKTQLARQSLRLKKELKSIESEDWSPLIPVSPNRNNKDG